MIDPSVLAPPAPDHLFPDPAERQRAEEVVRALSKVLRAYQLYEGAGPTYATFRETLRQSMESLWELAAWLQIEIEEEQILWRGTSVYKPSQKADNFVTLLYHDGIRQLTFLAGFEEHDLDTFLAILARVHRGRGEDEDLVTLFWEHDLPYLEYSVVEILPDGVELPTAQAAEGKPVDPATVRSDAQETPPRVAPVSYQDQTRSLLTHVLPPGFRDSLYFLDDAELRTIAAEIQRESARDLWADVISAMADRLEEGDEARRQRIIRIFGELLPMLLGAGSLREAALLLRELSLLERREPPLSVPLQQEIRAMFQQLANPDGIREMVGLAEEMHDAGSVAAFGALLGFFPAEALLPLLREAEGASRPEVRRSLAAAVERLAQNNTDRLSAFLTHSDALVVAGAARLLGKLGVTDAAGNLAGLLKRKEASVRLAAVTALRELRSSVAANALQSAINDPDRDVRIAAVRGLESLRYSPGRGQIEAVITSRRLRDADVTERLAFFEAYGTVAGAEGVELLNRLLNGKTWLGRREPSEIRASAALALGRILDPAAQAALSSAAADSDPLVRSAVGRALRAGL